MPEYALILKKTPWLTACSTYPIKEDFLRAAESQGIPVVDDLQDLTTGHGAEHWLKWINRDVGGLLEAVY
jgi:alcohol oxidase